MCSPGNSHSPPRIRRTRSRTFPCTFRVQVEIPCKVSCSNTRIKEGIRKPQLQYLCMTQVKDFQWRHSRDSRCISRPTTQGFLTCTSIHCPSDQAQYQAHQSMSCLIRDRQASHPNSAQLIIPAGYL